MLSKQNMKQYMRETKQIINIRVIGAFPYRKRGSINMFSVHSPTNSRTETFEMISISR